VVHSIELLLDPGTEAATRRIWAALSEAGLHSPGQASRPHVTLVVADAIASDVDELLIEATGRLPLQCRLGAPMVFGGGGSRLTLVRLVVPTIALLSFQQEVHRICAPHAAPEPAPNTAAGRWTPHLTLARRVEPPQLAEALALRNLARDVSGRVVGLRHWDGHNRLEHEIPRPGRR
jgi:2'-5' RNA ligase